MVADTNGSAECSVGAAELHHIVHCSRVSLRRIAQSRFNYRFQNYLYLHKFFSIKTESWELNMCEM